MSRSQATPCSSQLIWCEQRIAELEQQVARLSGLADCGTVENFLSCSDEVKREYFAGFIRESSRRKELEQQLTESQKDAIDWENACAHWEKNAVAAQARIAELRDALEEFDDLIQHQYNGSREAMSDLTYAAQHGARALATTDNLDTLKQYRDKVIDECANECRARYVGDNNREDMEARRCANAVLKLKEKPL